MTCGMLEVHATYIHTCIHTYIHAYIHCTYIKRLMGIVITNCYLKRLLFSGINKSNLRAAMETHMLKIVLFCLGREGVLTLVFPSSFHQYALQ